MNSKIRQYIWNGINFCVIFALFYLPYYLFDGRLYLGGDDTRMYYAYPDEILKNFAMYSWVNISSLPQYLPNFHLIPILYLFSFLHKIIANRVIVFYFAYSLPFVLGFIYIQKLIRKIYSSNNSTAFVSALMYICSPILIISHMYYFLLSTWLVAIFPIIGYYFLTYISDGHINSVIKSVFVSVIFSVTLFSFPWILGLILPLIPAFCVYILSVRSVSSLQVKRFFLFFIVNGLSQLFWIIPLIFSFTFRASNELSSRLLAKDLMDGFVLTVNSTAMGNIVYPLLSLYQKSIAVNYNWSLKNTFLSYYDIVMPLGLIFIIILISGLINIRFVKERYLKTRFYPLMLSFFISLYLFTVNIGILKALFLNFRYIPGFSMFRNFSDKFSYGYIFLYAIIFGFCLHILQITSNLYKRIVFISIIVICIFFIPVKQIVVSPLWTTKNIYTTTTFPEEYITFLERIKSVVPNSSNIISFPQNISAYAVITEDNGHHAYVGTSPIKFLTGLTDVSGSASYPPEISQMIRNLITSRNYNKLVRLLSDLNVGYVLVTNNIPDQIKQSYIYDTKYLKFQDSHLLSAIVEKELIRSHYGNYILYSLKGYSGLFEYDYSLNFKKISPVMYELKLKNLNSDVSINFLESYHPGWKLFIYPKNELPLKNNILLQFKILFRNFLFDTTHLPVYPYGNSWTINKSTITSKYDNRMYDFNNDGSIDVVFVLYFLPQILLYISTIISIIGILILFFIIQRNR